MKSYNKIQYYSNDYLGQNIIAFDKLDGSNIRAEYNKKRGWYKFGTRNRMIDKSDANFGNAIDIFLNKYGDELAKVFRDKYSTIQNVVVFGEYYGKNSFAGQHIESDGKTITLFDVDLYKKGIISPYEFMDNFGHLDIPKVIYDGVLTEEFIQLIRQNKFSLSEGVIAKGIRKTKGSDITWMLKIKTIEWLNKVKSLYGDDYLKAELDGNKLLIDSYTTIS